MCLLNAICAFLYSQHLLSHALQLKSHSFLGLFGEWMATQSTAINPLIAG